MSSSQESGPSASSRPSFSEQPQDAIMLFDLHLRFLSDSYLSFFLERRKIEETYIEGLLRLHRKVKTVDIILDDPGRGDPSTTRAAWNEVRDNIAREADTRVAFLGTLTTDVINPLLAFKETQERIRKRIKEDLKEALTAHTDYADNTLPRLKRAYLRKCQDVEEHRAAATNPPPAQSFEPHNSSSSKPNPNISARPVVTAPQPLRPLDRRPSMGAPSHPRSPSTSTALQDLAHQGKRQLNQLMGFLDKGGNMKDFANRSDNALRSVRAKREADEADKEYRKAVHWLETLRLRRIKILESGYNSLESFVRENADTMKSILQRYTDNMIATAATQSQICEHGHRSIDRISSQRDTAMISVNIPRLLAAATPPPIYYYNYNVGECRDLIFGVSLVDYATARNLPEGEVPKIVKICIKEIDRRGLEAEGIYRVSGRHAFVHELQHKIECNEAVFAFNPAVDDIYAVASLLKQYLRELPESLFKFSQQERVQHSEDIEEHRALGFQLLRGKIRRLPAVHQATLKMIVEHLARVASHVERNKMDAKNLAIVFAGVIFGEDEAPRDLLTVHSWKDTLAEDLILNAHLLFQSSGSPHLPPASMGEPYRPATPSGPSYNTSGSMGPPPPPSPRRNTRITRSPSLPPRPPPTYTIRAPRSPPPPEDFTPQLPPHPPSSIHPSLRAGPMAANPSRQSLPAQPKPVIPVEEAQTLALVAPPPLGVRSISQESKRGVTPKTTPRILQSELPPEVPPSPWRERPLSPRPTPRLPPRPLSPDVQGQGGVLSSKSVSDAGTTATEINVAPSLIDVSVPGATFALSPTSIASPPTPSIKEISPTSSIISPQSPAAPPQAPPSPGTEAAPKGPDFAQNPS